MVVPKIVSSRIRMQDTDIGLYNIVCKILPDLELPIISGNSINREEVLAVVEFGAVGEFRSLCLPM